MFRRRVWPASPSNPSISLFAEPFSSSSCTRVVWLRQTTAATCVAEQTVFIHSPLSLSSLPLNPLTSFTPFLSLAFFSPPPSLSLSLSLFLRTSRPTNHMVLALTSCYRLTNRCRCNCASLFLPPSRIWFKVRVGLLVDTTLSSQQKMHGRSENDEICCSRNLHEEFLKNAYLINFTVMARGRKSAWYFRFRASRNSREEWHCKFWHAEYF